MTRVTRESFVWDTEMVKLYNDALRMFDILLVTECSPYIRGLQLVMDEMFGRWNFTPHIFNADKVLSRMIAVTPDVVAGELENLSRDQLTVLNQYINPILNYMKPGYGNFIDIMNGISYKTILEDVSQLYKYLEEFIYTE